MSLPDSGVLLSDCKSYQYAAVVPLGDGNGRTMTVIGLMPLATDRQKPDPGVSACMEVATRLGYSTLVLVSLFALRSQGSDGLPIGKDPVGPENDHWIREAAHHSDLVIAAWGDYPRIGPRVKAVMALLQDVDIHCIQSNRNGTPTHPASWRQKAPKIYRARRLPAMPNVG